MPACNLGKTGRRDHAITKMKKLLLFTALLQAATLANAQPWMKGFEGHPVKLEEVKEAYEANHEAYEAMEENEEEEGGVVMEGKNYHFSRWLWYWEHHLDENGYMVSPVQKMREWRKYQQSHRAQYKTTANGANWTFQGPDKSPGGYNGVGRINVVSFHPTDSATYWVGTAGGGAWKTTNDGLNWIAVNDRFPVLSVSDIVFNPLNPNTVYLCTGDKEAHDSYSTGVLKSTDGGVNWDTTALNWDIKDLKTAAGLIINPVDTNSLTLASSDGIYKSFDGGASWTLTQSGNFTQILANPIDTNVMYAVSTMSGPYQLYRTADGGFTWTQVTNFTSNSRLTAAVTKANPAIVRMVAGNASFGLDSIYTSSDTGRTFKGIFSGGGSSCNTNLLANDPTGKSCGGQAWYDLAIAISPTDSNFMVVGGVNTWYSADGGHSWVLANQWYFNQAGFRVIHADKHYLSFHPFRLNTLFECNDGGVYRTSHPTTQAWTDITNGLGITEFYRIALADNVSYVIGGAQDNGGKKVDNGIYSELTGGDGMDCAIEPTNSYILYTTQQYGVINRSDNKGGVFSNVSANIPGGQPTGAWITPIAIIPVLENLLAGYNKLYLSENHGSTWTAISPSMGGNISNIAVSQQDPNYIYIVVGNKIHYTKNLGGNWSTLNTPYSGTISDIKVDPNDATHIWISFSGYNASNKVADYTFANGWSQKTFDLPNISINCILPDGNDGSVYIGTDVGIFWLPYLASSWQTYDNNLPLVEVMDLDINHTTGEIWAGTYGRGIWKSPAMSPTTKIPSLPLATDAITIAPNPNNGSFGIQTENKLLIGQPATVKIISMNGETVWQGNVNFDASGSVRIQAQLPTGTYSVDVSNATMILARQKMVVYK